MIGSMKYSISILLFFSCFHLNFTLFLQSCRQSKSSLSGSRRNIQMISEKTQKYFKSTEKLLNNNNQVFGAGGTSTLDGLKNMDKGWNALKKGGWMTEPKKIVYHHEDISSNMNTPLDFDVAVCGGTLGLFYAIGLLLKGYTVCIIERGKVAGRSQEWNISEKELNVLIKLNILTLDELNHIKSITFNPARVGFKLDTSPDAPPNGFELYVTDILNLGIRPDILISILKQKFITMGGILFEDSVLMKVDVYSDRAVMNKMSTMTNPSIPTTTTTTTSNTTTTASSSSSSEASPPQSQISCRLILDSMGNASPISKQVRGAVEPDGICIVVGSCAQGYNATNNTYSDIIYTNSPISTKINSQPSSTTTTSTTTSLLNTDTMTTTTSPPSSSSSQLQYFWEAFPAGSGSTDRTTYLFTYMDAKPDRPSVSDIFDDYFELLPRYQGVNVDELQFIRFLYGVFPTYRASPIQTSFPRILAVGDASGIQSPLSFGGFGSLTRHINRVINALDESLSHDFISAQDMNAINAYQPNLAACWMFQRAMSVPINKNPKPDLIVNILSNSFSSMDKLGITTIKPFLQDVLQFFPLLKTLAYAAVGDPLTPIKIVPHVGLIAMADFLTNMIALFTYTMLSTYITPFIKAVYLPTITDERDQFLWKRRLEAWKFGSGLDYDDHE